MNLTRAMTVTVVLATLTVGNVAKADSITISGLDKVLGQLYYGLADQGIFLWSDSWRGSPMLLKPTGNPQAALLKFDLSGLPAGITINSATLRIYAQDH